MKILFLSAWYPHRYDPMPGLFVKQHAEAVSSLHEVAVLYVHACDVKKVEIEQSSIAGVYTTIVYYPSKSFFLTRVFSFLKAHYSGYKRLVSYWGMPDLVHVNILTRCGVVALLLKLVSKIPYVITEHWTRYLSSRNGYSGMLRKLITRLVVKQSNGLVTVSGSLKESMQYYGLTHSNSMVIVNSVDTDFFQPSSIALNSGKKVISHISCFIDAAKNISGMLDAVYELSLLRNDFEFHLIGEGPDWTRMVERSNLLGLTNNVIFFKGLKEGADLVKVYQNSLFTVLFSNYENMPVVIAESFACGKPVIATNVGGISEVVNKSNGLLVNSGNIQELVNALNYMLDSHKTFNSTEIRHFAVETFGKPGFVEKYNIFYTRAMKTMTNYRKK